MSEKTFHMTILGRTIEHLGTQMYKQRAPSIAELIANCWDAGAKSAWIIVPTQDDYDAGSSVITIMDNGEGMDEASVQDRYLVVGRNRRSEDGGTSHDRKVMGRKGIGKLAGFGLAEKVTVTTWIKDRAKAIQFSMSLKQLKADAGEISEIKFPWNEVDKENKWPETGTLIELSGLRHTTPIAIDSLTETLARRFSRTTRGEMIIHINDEVLADPNIDSMYDYPEDNSLKEEELPSGKKVKYHYQFAKKSLRSKELQGFVIYASERTAQAPPFFFNVESTASSQHSTRYVTGEIVADFLDEGIDDDSDVISTDRQELDWENEEMQELLEWGAKLSRKTLRDCAEFRGKHLENWVLKDSEFSERIDFLEPQSRKEISRFLKVLGQKSDTDNERTRNLADSLIRAYEFRTFHDVIDELEESSTNPDKLDEMLSRLHDWKVLESRALFEIMQGRLSIINKLEQMLVGNAPETASKTTYDNLHDLLAGYPWLFNPEWQVFVDEKTVGNQLREWGIRDCLKEMEKKRVDFLAFADGSAKELVIIELKRPDVAVTLEELQRLERYQVELMRAHDNCSRVLIYGGTHNIIEEKWQNMVVAADLTVMTWSDMFTRAKRFYHHYESILKGDKMAEGFRSKEAEVMHTRKVVETGSSHRSKEERKSGLGDSGA